MRYLNLLFSFVLYIGLIFVLNSPIKRGSTTLPPLGSFINPFSGFWHNAYSSKNKKDELSSEQLSNEVKIIYDERRVPHIFANSVEDLLFAQGYAIASERLWQMDITTRSVEGRTSEILGKGTIDQDKASRRLGLVRAAELAVKSWNRNEQGLRYIESFSAGVNHYIDHLSKQDLPLEFKLLNYKPEKWSAYKTALFIKAMAKTLNSRHTDIAHSNALEILGEERYLDLYPEYNKKQSPIIQEKSWESKMISLEDTILPSPNEVYPTSKRDPQDMFVGSNNWAVSGGKTKSGNAILANDPHLRLSLPSIWIEMHLVCPEFNAYGVSLPAMPGITLGFNEHIAWGQTNAGHDVFDLYTINWVDDKKEKYYLDGKIVEAEIVIEEIKVKDKSSVFDTVRYTHWGPVRKEKDGTEFLAQRWLSHDSPPETEVEIYLKINKSKNYQEFQTALKSFHAPAQNFVFSSVKGDIAMIVAGNLPRKKSGQGKFIQDGSTTDTEWKDFIPFEDLPQELNPKRDYVASANQHPTDESFPYYYNGGFEDFRGRYINGRLEALNDVGKEEMMNLQLDNFSLKAKESLPLLLKYLNKSQLSPKETQVIELLKNWDFRYEAESEAPFYFDKWWSSFYNSTFEELISLRKDENIPLPEDFRLIELLEEKTEHPIFDIKETAVIENKANIILKSFKDIKVDGLEKMKWSETRNTRINHLTNIPAFSETEIYSGGQRNTPNAISKYNGPSWRMVVEMDDPIKAYGVYPGGQSGNPGSEYFNSFIEDWANGEYYNLNNTNNPDDINAEFEIRLKPKK